MNKLRLIAILFCIGFFSKLIAQIDFDNYQIIENTGTLPEQFNSSYKDKLVEISQDSKKSKKKKQDEEFYIQTTYSLDKYLKSGYVMFNDPLSNYLNKIMKLILEKNNIEKDITVYVIRSTSINAFALNDKVVFVTLGMLAFYDTEAQLAYTLCHEYIHYQNKHVFNEYKTEKIIESDYRRNRGSKNDVMLAQAKYSRELEKEADREGFKLFTNTGYNVNGAKTTFDVLARDYDIFYNGTYSAGYLETKYLKVPMNYVVDTLIEVTKKETEVDEDENLSTHPELDDRKFMIESMIFDMNLSPSESGNFIISESEFRGVQKMARYELLRLYLLDRRYERAQINALELLKDNPNSLYLKKIILKSIYGLSCYSNAKKISRVHLKYKKVEGELQRFVRMIDNMNAQELSYFGLNYGWRLHKEFPEDTEVKAICDELFDKCGKSHKLSPFYFKKELPTDSSVFKSDGKKSKSKKNVEYLSYGFIDLIQDGEFRSEVTKYYDKYKETEVKEDEETTDQDGSNSKKKKSSILEDKDEIENLDKLLLFEPYSIMLDLRKKSKAQYLATETQTMLLEKDIVDMAKKLKLQIDIISTRNLEADPEKLNDYMYVSEFMDEKYDHDGVEVLPVDKLKIDNICDKYGVDNIGTLALFKYKNEPNVFMNVIFIMTLYLAPIGIANLVVPKYSTIFYTAIYNSGAKGEVYSKAFEVNNSRYRDSQLANLYYLLAGLKK